MATLAGASKARRTVPLRTATTVSKTDFPIQIRSRTLRARTNMMQLLGAGSSFHGGPDGRPVTGRSVRAHA
jgi:hypothetical protein